MPIEYATKRIMDSVWTLAFVRQEEGVKILAYSRDIEEGYENEREWGLRCLLIEEDWRDKGGYARTVVAVRLHPYRSGYSRGYSEADAVVLPVINPQEVFSYGKEIPQDLVQLAYALDGDEE